MFVEAQHSTAHSIGLDGQGGEDTADPCTACMSSCLAVEPLFAFLFFWTYFDFVYFKLLSTSVTSGPSSKPMKPMQRNWTERQSPGPRRCHLSAAQWVHTFALNALQLVNCFPLALFFDGRGLVEESVFSLQWRLASSNASCFLNLGFPKWFWNKLC